MNWKRKEEELRKEREEGKRKDLAQGADLEADVVGRKRSAGGGREGTRKGRTKRRKRKFSEVIRQIQMM